MNHVSQTKGKNRSSRRYTHPTLAQTSRENGAPTVWKSETKSTTGKRTGRPASMPSNSSPICSGDVFALDIALYRTRTSGYNAAPC